MKRHFTKIELKIIKFKLMQKGMSEAQAFTEITGMIDCVENNHRKKIKRERGLK